MADVTKLSFLFNPTHTCIGLINGRYYNSILFFVDINNINNTKVKPKQQVNVMLHKIIHNSMKNGFSFRNFLNI